MATSAAFGKRGHDPRSVSLEEGGGDGPRSATMGDGGGYSDDLRIALLPDGGGGNAPRASRRIALLPDGGGGNAPRASLLLPAHSRRWCSCWCAPVQQST